MCLRKFKRKISELVFYSRKPPGIIEDIRQVAIDRGWEIKEIHQPFLVDVPIPRGVKNAHTLTYYRNSASMGFGAQYLVCIPDAVSSGSGFIRFNYGRFLSESTRDLNVLLSSQVFRSLRRRKCEKMSGDCYCLRTCWGDEYAHWFYEDLPRFSNTLQHLPEDTTLIVPDNIKEWRIQSLEALGVDRARIKRVPQHVEIECERLWFATELGSKKHLHTSPEVARGVSRKLLDYASQQLEGGDNAKLPTSEHIFISREGAPCKRLMNEAELEKTLEKLGFEIVMMENYSLPEQAEIIKGASVVVGAHGAGLTNMMFAKPNTILVELQDDSYACPRPWYWKLTNCFGCHYKTIIGQTTKTDLFEKIEFRLDPVFFERALSDICASRSNMEAQDRDWYDTAWYEAETQLPA